MKLIAILSCYCSLCSGFLLPSTFPNRFGHATSSQHHPKQAAINMKAFIKLKDADLHRKSIALLSVRSNNDDFVESTTTARVSDQSDPDLFSLSQATLVGAGLIGLTLGLVGDVALGAQVALWVPPLVGTVAASTAVYYLLSKNSRYEQVALKYIGAPTLSAANQVAGSVTAHVEEKKAQAAKKVKVTVSYIRNIPSNAKQAARNYVENQLVNIRNKIESTKTKVSDFQSSTLLHHSLP